MRQEIFGQPQLLAECLPRLRDAVGRLDLGAGRVFAGGCGDGLFAAGAGAGLFAESAVDYRAMSALELGWHCRLGVDDLVLLLSISGGTRRTVEAAYRARAAGARTLAITCGVNSELAQACDDILLLPFTPLSRRTPHTADYLVSLLALAVLAESVNARMDSELDGLPTLLQRVIEQQRTPTMTLAAGLKLEHRIFILGQGANLATAQYIAAKFHESGGLCALWNETENFVHGMNFMPEADDLICVIGDDGPGSFRAMELIPGLTRLCRRVALIGTATAQNEIPGATDSVLLHLATPMLRPALTVFANAVIGQLLCLGLIEAYDLPVELPRAGRSGGAMQAEVQYEWMMQTKIHPVR